MKKKTYIYAALTSLMILSCKPNDLISVKENISNETVLIEPGIKNHITIDSVPITIPIELEISVNTANLEKVSLYFITINNKRLLNENVDYEVFNKNNKEKSIYFSLNEDELDTQRKYNIIIKVATQMVSRKEVSELLKKYNSSQSLENLNSGRMIKLISYKKFRKENHKIIRDFQKINDTIVFVVHPKIGENILVKKKINW